MCIPKQKFSLEGHSHDTRKQYPMIIWPLVPLCMFLINFIINLLYCICCLDKWIAWLSNTKFMVVLLSEFNGVVDSVFVCVFVCMFSRWLDGNQSSAVIISRPTLTLCCSVVCKIVCVSVFGAYTKICGLWRKSYTEQQKDVFCSLCDINNVVGLWAVNSQVKN